MKVILNENIKGIGKKDDVINASDGYARNYLFPKKLAVEANTENMNKLKARQNCANHKKDLEIEQAKKTAKKISEITLKLKVKAGNNGKIFGGVTSKEIAESLKKEYQIIVDKKKIELKETVKTLGTITVEIKLYEGIVAKLKVMISPE